MTVREAVEQTCDTGTCKPLSDQVIAVVQELAPGLLVPVKHPQIRAEPRVNLFLQRPARDSLLRVLDDRPGKVLTIISLYRTCVQQVMLRAWHEAGKCGIPLAALPGNSNHEDAAGIDVANSATWRGALRRHGWEWLGPKDPAHYSYRGPGFDNTVGRLGIRAFQVLANRHGAELEEDGVYGPVTRAAILAAPAAGWPEEEWSLTINGNPVPCTVEGGTMTVKVREMVAACKWNMLVAGHDVAVRTG